MKRFVIVLVVLTIALGTALAIWIARQSADRQGPPGSSGVIEGTRVQVAARLPARIRALHAREGDGVKAGDLLVELDCSEPDALVAEAGARIEAAKAQVAAARAQAEEIGRASCRERG